MTKGQVTVQETVVMQQMTVDKTYTDADLLDIFDENTIVYQVLMRAQEAEEKLHKILTKGTLGE
tara:strand:+ start:1224 stop:1415 length:192 start_codon:yes stop_codon:yes gene_type:complete